MSSLFSRARHTGNCARVLKSLHLHRTVLQFRHDQGNHALFRVKVVRAHYRRLSREGAVITAAARAGRKKKYKPRQESLKYTYIYI